MRTWWTLSISITPVPHQPFKFHPRAVHGLHCSWTATRTPRSAHSYPQVDGPQMGAQQSSAAFCLASIFSLGSGISFPSFLSSGVSTAGISFSSVCIFHLVGWFKWLSYASPRRRVRTDSTPPRPWSSNEAWDKCRVSSYWKVNRFFGDFGLFMLKRRF